MTHYLGEKHCWVPLVHCVYNCTGPVTLIKSSTIKNFMIYKCIREINDDFD